VIDFLIEVSETLIDFPMLYLDFWIHFYYLFQQTDFFEVIDFVFVQPATDFPMPIDFEIFLDFEILIHSYFLSPLIDFAAGYSSDFDDDGHVGF
jgi:hypothetical protein